MSLSRFFLDCNNGISPRKVRNLKIKYGDDILIGVDPGMGDTPDEDAQNTIDSCKELDLAFHVYLVGPGMMDWSEEEANQVRQHAKSVGINTKEKGWHKKWFDDGWLKKAKQQFKYYNQMGAYSCEIDNMDGPLENDPDDTIEAYLELQAYFKEENIKTKLMIKNLDEDQLEALIENVNSGKLSKDLFTEWGMFEEAPGDPDDQYRLAKKI